MKTAGLFVVSLTLLCAATIFAAPNPGDAGAEPTVEQYVSVRMPPAFHVESTELDGPVFADARGRTGFEDRDYTQAALFIKFQQAAKSVNSGEIAKHYSDGVEIQKAIHDARLVEIRRVQKNSALDS